MIKRRRSKFITLRDAQLLLGLSDIRGGTHARHLGVLPHMRPLVSTIGGSAPWVFRREHIEMVREVRAAEGLSIKEAAMRVAAKVGSRL